MTGFEQQVQRCRERLMSTWPTALPLAGIAALYAASLWAIWGASGDRLAVTVLATGLALASALFIGIEQRAKRRKTMLALGTAPQAVLGLHDPNRGLMFVTPAGVFIEAVGYVVPFVPAPSGLRIAACRYLPREHTLRVELTGRHVDEVADFRLPPAVTPQQAEAACRLAAAALAPAR